MHSINLIKQAPLAHSSIWCSRAPSCHAPCQDSWKITTRTPKTMKRTFFYFFFYNQTWTRCMFCFFAQRRLEELCSLLSFSWSLDYSHTGYAEILKQAGKGALSMQNILLYGNESSMWQLLNSSEPPKQMLLLMVGEEVSAASKSKSNAYLCLYSVCLALFLSFFFFPPLHFLLWSRAYTENRPCFSGLGRGDISRDRQ